MAFTRASNGIRSREIDRPRTIAADGPSITTMIMTITMALRNESKHCDVTFVLEFPLTGSKEARSNPKEIPDKTQRRRVVVSY